MIINYFSGKLSLKEKGFENCKKNTERIRHYLGLYIVEMPVGKSIYDMMK